MGHFPDDIDFQQPSVRPEPYFGIFTIEPGEESDETYGTAQHIGTVPGHGVFDP